LGVEIQTPLNSVYHCPSFDRLPGYYNFYPEGSAYAYNIGGAESGSTPIAGIYIWSGLGLAGHAVPFRYTYDIEGFVGVGPPPIR